MTQNQERLEECYEEGYDAFECRILPKNCDLTKKKEKQAWLDGWSSAFHNYFTNFN